MTESKAWIPVGIFITAFFIGMFFGCIGTSIVHIDDYEIPKYAARQELFTLPDGSTWKRIRTPEEIECTQK